MKKTLPFIIILFLLVFLSKLSISQHIPVLINFDTVLTKTVSSKSFYIKNPSGNIVTITNIRTTSPEFYFISGGFSINPYDSVQVTVFFSTKHNITFRDFIIFETDGLNYSHVNYLTATGKYTDALYNFTQGLRDENLKSALNNFTTQGYISLGYDNARNKMFELIDDYGGDTIECVYTGTRIKAVNRTEAQNQGFDTEHTYPQSFFNSGEPMRSDIYHLYPTLSTANNARSNYHFGYVVSNITWQMGGSKRGYDYQNEIVFETRDKHKGNVARSLFYFIIRYGNLENYLLPKEEGVLRMWNSSDTVDNNERLRNQRVKSFQNVFNPFIDHPEFAERIRSFSSTAPTINKGEITVTPFSVIFDTLAVNDTAGYYLGIINYGNSSLTINSVLSNIPQFIIENYPSSVPAGEISYAKLKFKPTEVNHTYNGIITISNSDSTLLVNLTGFSNSNVGIGTTGNDIPDSFVLYENYPNPFNASTMLRFDIPVESEVSLVLFDAGGRTIKRVFENSLKPGCYNYLLDMSEFSCGVYFLRFTGNDFIRSKKLIYLK